MKKYCLALDLVADEALIAEYERWHQPQHAWPEIKKSITDAGITNMEIYRTGNRLFMIMETEDDFSFEKKAAMDRDNPRVAAWEQLMAKFQSTLPWAKKGEKWVMMDKIFELNASKNV